MALISLRMLLESPNPKDPQDAEVAKMLMEHPNEFAQKAHDWAVKYAGAPRQEVPKHNYKEEKEPAVVKDDATRYDGHLKDRLGETLLTRGPPVITRYQGYNKELIDRFVHMGFDVDKVVEAFNFVGIDRNGGEDYELEEAYMGDITARLLGEQ